METIQVGVGERGFIVEAPYRFRDVVKAAPGARWGSGNQRWKIPPTYANVHLLAESLKHSPVESEWSEDAKFLANLIHTGAVTQHNAKVEVSSGLSDETRQSASWERLTKHQKIGVGWLIHGSSILADEMGSGKTVQACVAAEEMAYRYFHNHVLKKLDTITTPFKMLIVCPVAVIPVWERHLEEWTTIKPFVVRGNISKRRQAIRNGYFHPGAAALIINWESLKSHSKLAAFGQIERSDAEMASKELNIHPFQLLIADEAHRAKSPRAKQTRALWAIDADMKWALTGTPLANEPTDFWSLLHFIAPEDWSSRVKFIDNYCDVENNYWSGGQTVVGFNRHRRPEFDALTDYRFLRRQTSTVIGRHIRKNRIQRYAELSLQHRRFYDALRRSILTDLDGREFMLGTFLERTTRLAQAASAMLWRDDVNDKWEMIERDANGRLKYPSPKINCLIDLENDLTDEPVVVISASKQLMKLTGDRYERNKIAHVYVDGDTGPVDRQEAVEAFQKGDANRLLCTTGVMSEGVDLAVARVMVFLGRPWSMIQSDQSEDRIYRLTQSSDSVDIIDIITEDTIDQRIYEVLNRKQRTLAELTRDQMLALL